VHPTLTACSPPPRRGPGLLFEGSWAGAHPTQEAPLTAAGVPGAHLRRPATGRGQGRGPARHRHWAATQDILAVPVDRLQHNKDGSPVLVYDNAKADRLRRRLPITQATAAVITAQQARVRARYPDPLAGLRGSRTHQRLLAEFTDHDYSLSNPRIKRLIRHPVSGSFRRCARNTPIARVWSVPAVAAVRRKRAVIRTDSVSGASAIAFVIDSLCCACRSRHMVVNHPVTASRPSCVPSERSPATVAVRAASTVKH
jgi:hypothetical protein